MTRNRLSAATRISIGLAGLTMTLLLAAHFLGFVPDRAQAVLEGRKALCEAVAVTCSLAAEEDDARGLQAATAAMVQRNPDVLSAAVRRADGRAVVEVGSHRDHWQDLPDGKSTPTQMMVPVFAGEKPWGRVEIRFRSADRGGVLAFLGAPTLGLSLFLGLSGFVVYLFYLRRTLQHLDPSTVIPERVKAVLNVMSEGVLVLDREERIVLANDVFAAAAGAPAEALQGRRLSSLPWTAARGDGPREEPPWTQTIRDGSTWRSVAMNLPAGAQGPRTFMVNVTPILAGEGSPRGALATFDDVTSVEQTNLRLREALAELQQSRDEVKRQNRTLEVLATQDSLTACLNRRSFFERFDSDWHAARRYGFALSCVMVDLDHFKRVNDLYGHRVGDTVLQQVAEVLRTSLRPGDLICRYGGEEFCIVLSHADLDEAAQAAERLRSLVESTDFCGIPVTISVGVSGTCLNASEPKELLDQADRGLYAAKHRGRNLVFRWDEVPEALALEATSSPYVNPPSELEGGVPIPFPAVACLVSALAHRDLETAKHSRRVADLCVAAVRDRMTARECYVLEVAALLHDIGKLGVPDTILLKPGPLTDEEWLVMRTHDQMGVQIVTAAFASAELTQILQSSHAWYGGNPHNPSLPKGEDISLGARILAVADAFDAMTTDRLYRKARSIEDAIAELRRCAGTQFDPRLVEMFIEGIRGREALLAAPSAMLPTEAALGLAREAENLARAVEARDVAAVAAIARRLHATALAQGVNQMADIAGRLARCTDAGADAATALELADELLDLLRAAQVSRLPRRKALAEAPVC